MLLDTVVVGFGMLCAWLMFFVATVLVGDSFLYKIILARIGKRHWYMTRTHVAIWIGSLALAALCGLLVTVFNQSILISYPWLYAASLTAVLLYLCTGFLNAVYILRNWNTTMTIRDIPFHTVTWPRILFIP